MHGEDVDDYTMCVCGSPMDACPVINGEATDREIRRMPVMPDRDGGSAPGE